LLPLDDTGQGLSVRGVDRERSSGAALADQVKSLDWVVRKANYKGKVSSVELAEVREKIFALIGKG
jgi:mRNA interferase MazF